MLYNLGTLAMLIGGVFFTWVLLMISIENYFGD